MNNIKEAELFTDKKKKKEKIKFAKETISGIQKIRKRVKKGLKDLSDEQKKSMNISTDDVDFFVLRAFGWIDKSSTKEEVKITKKGKMRATAFYYSHPENKKDLAKYMTHAIKEDERDRRIDEKAKNSRNKRTKSKRAKKKAKY